MLPLHTDRIEVPWLIRKILAAGERGRYAAQSLLKSNRTLLYPIFGIPRVER